MRESSPSASPARVRIPALFVQFFSPPRRSGGNPVAHAMKAPAPPLPKRAGSFTHHQCGQSAWNGSSTDVADAQPSVGGSISRPGVASLPRAGRPQAGGGGGRDGLGPTGSAALAAVLRIWSRPGHGGYSWVHVVHRGGVMAASWGRIQVGEANKAVAQVRRPGGASPRSMAGTCIGVCAWRELFGAPE